VNRVAKPLTDWLSWLETLSPNDIDMGLERVERVLARLSPQLPQIVIHVAGTNGKGSCVEMLAALFANSDEKVGLYTSPHIIRYNERIRVAGEEATDAQIIAAFERIEAVREGEALTYFEYGTLAALIVFAEAGVNIGVFEVGMGGRLDAVNAIEPDAGLITNIALDHCDWLGADIEAIALEKAGIMRTDKPVVFGSRDMPQAIADRANATGADLRVAGHDYDWSSHDSRWSWRGKTIELPNMELPGLAGQHQLDNAAAVLALLEAAGFDRLLQQDRVNESLGSLHLDGRMQRVAADRQWLLDVAHNPAAATALAQALQADAHCGQTVAIVGMLQDKDVEGVIGPLAGVVDHWIAVSADSPRGVAAAELARRAANVANAPCLVADSLDDALGRARELASPDDQILVTGSFYLVGPVLNQLYSRRK
jgi:dihydrofolate synthase/folylpolyglutamate synthase